MCNTPYRRPEHDDLPAIAVALIGTDASASMTSLREQSHQGWRAALIPGDASLSFERDVFLAFLDEIAPEADLVVVAPSTTRFKPTAMAHFADALESHADARAVYSDLEWKTEDGSRWPLFFPAFDYERLLEQGYCAYLFAARLTDLRQALANGADNLFALMFSLAGPNADILHVPCPLAMLPQLDGIAISPRLAEATIKHLRIARHRCKSELNERTNVSSSSDLTHAAKQPRNDIDHHSDT